MGRVLVAPGGTLTAFLRGLRWDPGAKVDPKYIREYTNDIIITTHLAEGDPKRTSLGIPYARMDASEASEA
ncbi:hypothetical protein C0992_006013 [Termitomyces sp. T32_za158]|nr:hypothetical protein C0992_006013 [Termitomyces sp. T32_za158]